MREILVFKALKEPAMRFARSYREPDLAPGGPRSPSGTFRSVAQAFP